MLITQFFDKQIGKNIKHYIDLCNEHLYERYYSITDDRRKKRQHINTKYIRRRLIINNVQKSVLFSVDALGLPDDFLHSKYSINHINRNTLDDRRCNLQIVTIGENIAHARQYNGVHYDVFHRCWCFQPKTALSNIDRAFLNTYHEAQAVRQLYHTQSFATRQESKDWLKAHSRTIVAPVLPAHTVLGPETQYDYLIRAEEPAKREYMRSLGFDLLPNHTIKKL